MRFPPVGVGLIQSRTGEMGVYLYLLLGLHRDQGGGGGREEGRLSLPAIITLKHSVPLAD